MTERSSPVTIEILPCPSCGKPPGQKVGPPAMARCITAGCEGKNLAAVTLVEWNTRASQPAATVGGDEYTKGYRDGWNDREARATGDDRSSAASGEALELAECFDADQLRGYSPIRNFTPRERRMIATALRGVAQPSPVQEALELAVNIIMANEPGHSCAVSNEAVALAAVSVGDTSDPVMKVIREALAISSTDSK